MANQVNKDAIVRFLAGYESDLAAVKVENGTVYFALKPDPLNASNTIGSIYLDADGKRIMMSGESLAVRDELGDRILTKYIKGIDFGANTGEQGKISYIKGDNSSVNVNVPSASASAAGFVTTGAQTFAGTKTFNSPLIPLGGSYVHSATGTSGTSGYVKIATFKINGTYQNMPIVIELVDRVRKGSCVLNIQFQNVNSNDPTLATFTFEGVDYNCHLYKSATSTWDLYVQKGEAHGQPTVVRFHKSPYMSKVAVTWTNAHADTIPSGAQKAVLGGNVANASKADSATKATQDGSGNNIQTTYLRDLDSESSTSGFKFWGVKGNSSTATEITIPDASTTIAGLVNTTAQTFAGRKTFNGGVEFNVKDFDYSAIEQGTSDAYRVVWFADSSKKGKPVYDSSFTYNPSSKTLKASNFDGLATKSTGDGQGNNIYTTYLSDLTSTNDASIFTIQGIKKNGGNSPTTITINGATTEKAGLMTAEEQSFAGEKEFTDTTTFSGTSGFEYSGIESATSNSARVVWFAHASKKGTPVYHNDFTYNPGTKTLTVGKISGTITKATGDGQGNEIYSTYLADVASSNDGTTFNIWGLTKKGGDSPTTVTIEGATTEKAGLVTTGAQTWAGAKTFNNDITISGANTNIQKGGSSTSWIYGRDTALVKLTSYKGYNAITSMKTTNGDWSYGVYSDDISYWTYTPDTQYDAQDNKGYVQMKLTPAGKLITVNSETGHLFAKSIAIGSDNTNYKLYNSGTTYLADALTVAARATVDTLKISKTDAAKHIEFARGGFNYIATAANGCIAFLPNGASTGEDTSRLIVEDGGARPGATNTYNLGTSGKRWKNIYGNALNISGASTLTGAVTLGGNLSVGGTLGVTGATTLSSTLTVTGKTVLSSVVEIGNDLTVTGAILGKDKLTIGQADLNTDYTVYVNGASYFKGNVTSNGTLHLTKTTDSAATADNNVALIIGPRDGTHLIADNNEIMAKSNGTAAGPLYLNNDGGQVVVGAGGFTTSGYSDTTGGNGFRIRRSDVTYGRFYAITAGTTSVTGIGQLTLGNSTSTGTANNAAGVLRLYGLGDKYTDIRTVQGSGNHAYYFSNHGQTGYSIARGAVQAYGGLTTPVWINANGNVVAFVDTIGSTSKPVYMKDGAITEITPADMFSVLKWNAGTTAGPTLDMTIGTYRRTAVIPSATKDNSGVVTTTTQTFSGDKTFANAVNVTGKATFDSLVELKNELSVAGGLIAKDSLTVGQETLNTTYKFYVKGNSGFSGDATLSGTLHLTNTTNSAASSDPNVALVIGDRAAQHLLIDDRGIQSKQNGTAADTLSLNPNGGTTLAGGNIQTANTFRATGLDKGYQLYRNSVSYGHLYVDTDGTACTTDGTAGTAGVAILTLGNSTAQSSTLNSGKNNAYGVVRLYSTNTGYGDIRYVSTTAKRTYYISNHGATAYSLGRASSSKAYGSTVKPVWFNSSGMVTAFVDTVGSTAIPVYMNEGAITQVKPEDMFSELKWDAGTSAGPVINMTIGTQNRTATIPTATQTNSGVVIAGPQTFGGAKTFTDSVTVNGATTLKSAVKIENDLTVDGTIFGNDNISLNHASNPYIQFKINSTVIGYVQASGKKMAIGPSFSSSIRIDENGKIFTPANVGIGGEPQDAYMLYNHGTTYFAGKTTIANDLLLHGNILYANGSYTDLPVIRFVTGSNDGTGVVIGGGGIAIFGSGESANNLYTNLGTTVNGATETTYITGDGDIVFYSNCQTIGSRVGAKFTTARAFVPEVSQLGSIGTSSLEWGAIYAVNETLSGTLTVNGASTLKGAVTMNSTLLVSGESTFRNNVTIGPNGYAEKHISMYIDRKKTGGGGWAWNQISLRGSDGVDFAHYGVLGNADALTYIFIGTKAYNEDNFRIYADGSIWAVNGTLKGSLSVGTTSTFTGVATFKSPVTMENELTVNGLITSKGNIHITNSNPNIKFTDTGKNNQVYYVQGCNGNLYFGPGSANSPYVDSTGVLHTIANKYTDNYTDAGLNLHNSDIVGVNSIYTADASENSQEGIHFYRDATHVDTIWVAKGVMYFTPNRTIGGAGTSYYIARTATENGNVGSTNTLTYVEGGVIKATTANIGNVRRPLFMSSGQLTTCDAPASGAWFTGVPSIGADGVMEIGRYIDFHSTNTTAKDYSIRIDAGTGDAANTLYLPDITGQVVVHTNNTQIGSGVKPVYVATSGAVTASSSTLGGTAKPIWMSAGELKACSATVGATDKPVFMSAGEIKPSTSSLGNNTKFIYMSSGQIKASTATVGGDTRPVYLSAGTVTPIAYTAIAYGGTGATTRGQAINNLLYVGNNPITSTTNDTTANWAQYSNTVSFYTTAGYLVSQPQQYGLVLTIGAGNNTQELHQIWSSQPHGDLWHRGGNGSSWGGTWRKILDTSNYTSTMDGRYVNVSGDTMTGSLTIAHATSATMDYTTTNPRIVFSESGTQPVGLVYTDYDNYRSPAGLKVLDMSGTNGKAWFEVEGNVYASKVYNAVWNDYAEYRKADTEEPGRVVIEGKFGIMTKSTARLQAGASIISDTFGSIMGLTDDCKTPIAVAGRVLTYTHEDRNSYPLGAAVCTGPNGTVSLMTREEIMTYPERIVGTVSEIPDYESWESSEGPIQVNGRIWIKVK